MLLLFRPAYYKPNQEVLMSKTRLLTEGPNEETMDKTSQDKKEKNRRKSGCCPRLFSRPDDNSTLMKETNPNRSISMNSPVAQNRESKRSNVAAKDDDCCTRIITSKVNSSKYRRGGGSVYVGISYLDYELKSIKQKKSDPQKTNEHKSNSDNPHIQPDDPRQISNKDSTQLQDLGNSQTLLATDQTEQHDILSSADYHQMNSNDVGEHDASGFDSDHHNSAAP